LMTVVAGRLSSLYPMPDFFKHPLHCSYIKPGRAGTDSVNPQHFAPG
jgi:hypothetical protein